MTACNILSCCFFNDLILPPPGHSIDATGYLPSGKPAPNFLNQFTEQGKVFHENIYLCHYHIEFVKDADFHGLHNELILDRQPFKTRKYWTVVLVQYKQSSEMGVFNLIGQVRIQEFCIQLQSSSIQTTGYPLSCVMTVFAVRPVGS